LVTARRAGFALPLFATVAAVTLLAGGGALPGASSPVAGAAVPNSAVAFKSSLPAGPAFNGDAGDPDVVESAGTFYAFTTGTPLGNHIQELVDTTGSPASGWHSYTGTTYGSTALPTTPGWEATNTQTSPGVFNYDNQWVMFYDAAQAGHATGTGYDCLSVATAGPLSPTGTAFTDNSGGPLICQSNLGGAIDPSPFIDPATGMPWLIWKSNDGGSSQPARIWSEELNSTGTGFYPGSAPTEIFYNNTTAYPWEATVEDPSILPVNGQFDLLFSGGIYTSANYAEGYAVCTTPIGPCTQTDPSPILSSYGTVAGPGGGSWFEDSAGNYWLDYAAWTAGCTSYACGGARRLFVTPIDFGGATSTGISFPAVGVADVAGGGGYWVSAADGGIFSYGDAKFYGSTGALHLNAPVVGMTPTPDGGGYWMVGSDGGIFTFGDAKFYGSTGALHLNAPIVGMASTPDGDGYWLVAADGGIFSFGDARFYGSTGALHLNAPVVGMAASPSGAGYWLVARDGGIFSFGDATFKGSTGALHLNAPIVGMAANPGGEGYWLVGADGGIFSFGSAGFFGSAGDLALAAPVVSMAATPNGQGYTLAASDGGIFTYGNAKFYGSPA
jgi:hypothetical protein